MNALYEIEMLSAECHGGRKSKECYDDLDSAIHAADDLAGWMVGRDISGSVRVVFGDEIVYERVAGRPEGRRRAAED